MTAPLAIPLTPAQRTRLAALRAQGAAAHATAAACDRETAAFVDALLLSVGDRDDFVGAQLGEDARGLLVSWPAGPCPGA